MSSTTFDIQVNTQQALASINSLRGSLASLAGAAAAVGFGTMIDDMANLKNKMSQVVVEGQSVTDMMKIMSKESLAAGTSIETYANTFYTLSKGTSNLNLSQQKTIDLTSTISKALTLGSTSAQGAANAMEQLGQMFAKGYAEGDDLNTVLENSATISEALQKHYHADAGALKVLAENHKILSKGIYESIASIKEATNTKFAERYITLNESMNVLKTTAMTVADKFAEQTNLGQALEIVIYKLATVMIKVSNAMDWLGKVLEVVGILFLTFGGAVGKVIGFLERLWAIGAGAFGGLVEGITGAVHMARVLWTAFTGLIESGTSGLQAFRIVFASFSAGISEAAGAATTLWGVMLEGIKTIATWLGLVSAWEAVTGLFGKTEEGANALTKAQEAYNEALGVTAASSQKAARDSSLMNAEQAKLQMAGVKGAEDLAKAYADLHNQMTKSVSMTGLGDEQKTMIEGRMNLLAKYKDAVAGLQREANKQIALNPDDDVAKAKTLEILAESIDQVKQKFQEAIVVYNADAEALQNANRATEQRTFALSQLYAQQDAINNLNREAAKVGLSVIDQKYKDIRNSAQDAADAQLRSLAAARGITVDQLPAADKAAVIDATTKKIREQEEAQKKLNDAQNADSLSTQLQKLRIDQDEKLKKLGEDASNIGLPTLTKRYNEIEAAAARAERAQLNALASARGVTVEELPAADKAAIHEANAASINKEKEAVKALNDAEIKNDMRQAVLKHQYDQQATLRKLQDDINKTTLSETARAYYDIGAAADEAAKAEIRLAAEKQGIKPEELPIEQVKAYYEANFAGIDQLISKTRELQAAQEAQLAVAFATKEKTAAAAKLQQIQDETAKLGMTEIEKKYYDIEAAARASAEAELAAVAARQGVDRSQLDSATVEKYYKAATQGTYELKAATAQGYAQSRTFATGWKQALNSYTEDATNAANQAGRLFKTTTQGMEDMIVKFAKTGKFEWKGFLSSIVEELLRSQITILLSNILNGGKSGSGGNGLIGGIADMLGLGGDSGIGGAISSALGGGSSGKSGSGVLGSYSNPMYVIVAGSQAGSTMNQVGKQGNSVLGSVINAVTKPAQSGTSWWDDITGGISDFFTGNTGASSSNSSYGVLQSDQNSGTSIFDDIGDFFGGLFATGGNLPTGKWGIAGEAGPELIRGPASISSASQTASDFGGTNVTYNINAVDAASFKAMIAADPSFIYAVTMQGARGMPKR